MHALLEVAKKAREWASPVLSQYKVGAALETDDGTIITGANIESVIPVLSLCAERSAIASAISQGYRKFKRIAVIADYPNEPITPCGACRQFLLEFAPDAEIICGNLQGATCTIASVKQLLPGAYEFPQK